MSTYRSMIDEAMATARSRLNAGVKVASADTSTTKEASELANALEYLAISAANDGTSVGSVREEMLRDFFKQAQAAGSVPHGATVASGVQAQAPEAGKTKLAPQGLVGGARPMESSAPVGPGPKESFKQAGNQTLYDILMGNKTAGADPVVSSSTEDTANPGSSNENVNASQLKSEAGIVAMSKSEAKKPTRARLAEVFSHTSDSLAQETAQKLFPQANAGAGGVKEAAEEQEQQPAPRGGLKGALKGGLIGGTAGSALGAATGAALTRPLPAAKRVALYRDFLKETPEAGPHARRIVKGIFRNPRGAVAGLGAAGLGTVGAAGGMLVGGLRRKKQEPSPAQKMASVVEETEQTATSLTRMRLEKLAEISAEEKDLRKRALKSTARQLGGSALGSVAGGIPGGLAGALAGGALGAASGRSFNATERAALGLGGGALGGLLGGSAGATAGGLYGAYRGAKRTERLRDEEMKASAK